MFTNISRGKENHAMKFSQLIEHIMRKIFLEKLCTKFVRETIPRLFSKKWKLSISLNQYSKSFIYFVLIVSPVDDYRKWLKLNCSLFAFTSYKAFLKNKKSSGTILHAWFSAGYLKKSISVVIFYYLTKFQHLVAFTLWDIGQCIYCNCLLIRLWR